MMITSRFRLFKNGEGNSDNYQQQQYKNRNVCMHIHTYVCVWVSITASEGEGCMLEPMRQSERQCASVRQTRAKQFTLIKHLSFLRNANVSSLSLSHSRSHPNPTQHSAKQQQPNKLGAINWMARRRAHARLLVQLSVRRRGERGK